MNLEKTHFILFTNWKSVKNLVLKVNDDVIEIVKVTTFFGIYINENVSWKDHISYISNKLSKHIAIFSCVSSIINMDYLRNLYCKVILPYLSYCAMVWGNTYTVSPRYWRGLRSFPSRKSRIIDAVLKRLCMILYALKYASKTHSKDSLTHLYSNNVVICSNDQLKQ